MFGNPFTRLLGAATALLVLALSASFILPAPWSWAVGLVYVGYDTWLLLSMVLASRRALRTPPPNAGPRRPQTLAVLIAARNEREVLPQALAALFAQTSPAERVVLIDDGSTDGTRALLEQEYAVRFEGRLGESALHPALQVLSKVNSGKARSLNEALELVREDVVVTLDADTVLEPEALAAVRREFEQDEKLAAACGVLSPHCAGAVTAPFFAFYQTFEYLRGFLWRLAWMSDHTLVLVSGAFAAFRRERLAEVSGFDPHSRVEDYELMFRLHRLSLERGEPLVARIIGEARASTDAPARLPVFLRQRTRWFAGFIETMFRNQDLVGNGKFGRLGRYHLRVKTIDTLLPIYGLCALLLLGAFLASGRGLPPIILAVLAGKFLFDLTCHFLCVVMYRRWQGGRVDLRFALQALGATLTEPLLFQVFRQFGALLGWIAFLRGRIEWHPQRFAATKPAARAEEP